MGKLTYASIALLVLLAAIFVPHDLNNRSFKIEKIIFDGIFRVATFVEGFITQDNRPLSLGAKALLRLGSILQSTVLNNATFNTIDMYFRLSGRFITFPRDVLITDHQIKTDKGTTQLHLLSYTNGRNSGLIYVSVHAGGYASGTWEMDAGIEVAYRVGAPVVSVDYKLCPDHSIDEAIDEVISTLQWIVRGDGEKYGLSRSSKIMIGGSSAGGGLAALVLHRIESSNEYLKLKPIGAILMSPYLDLTSSLPSIKKNAFTDVILPPNSFHIFQDAIVKGAKGDRTALTRNSPLFQSPKGFPSLYISFGGAEMLVDECLAFAEKAKKEGVQVKTYEAPHLPHSFQMLFTNVPESEKAIQDATEWVQSTLLI